MENESCNEISGVETIQPISIPAPDIIVNGQEQLDAIKKKRDRNYSFLHKRPDSLDEVEVNGKRFPIPAGSVGSCFWGILKVAYQKHDQKIYEEELVILVAETMSDRDGDNWDKYCGKKNTTIHKKSTQNSTVQPTRPWQERVINNAKTLTRAGDYGKRLHEVGHAFAFDRDDKGIGYFILHTGEKAQLIINP